MRKKNKKKNHVYQNKEVNMPKNSQVIDLNEYSGTTPIPADNYDVQVGNEILHLSSDEAGFLSRTGIDFNDENWMNNDSYDINIRITALFAMNKNTDAWSMIEENIDKINYKAISSTRFFMYDRFATDIFKRLHDNGSIDDMSYEYFNVLSGRLFDHEYWTNRFSSCENLGQVLTIINAAYNGVSPYSVGLVDLDDYTRGLIDEFLVKDEPLDDYINDKPAMVFDSETIFKFIENGNIKSVAYALSIAMGTIDAFSENKTNESIHDFWLKVCDLINNAEDKEKYIQYVSQIRLSTLEQLDALVLNDVTLSTDTKLRIILNSEITTSFYNTVKYICNKNSISIPTDSLEHYLDDNKMNYVTRYMLFGFNCNNYIIVHSTLFNSYLTYNKTTDNIMIGNSCVGYDEFYDIYSSIVSNFKDDPEYAYHDMTKQEDAIMNGCQSEAEYTEFMHSLSRFMAEIEVYKIMSAN